MAWDACALEGGANVKSFTCDANAGEHVIVASFVLDPGITGFTALDADVVLGTIGVTSMLPDWWKTTAGSCREGAIGISFDFLDSPQTACLDPWSGQALASPALFDVITTPDLPPHGSSTYGRIRFGAVMPAGSIDLEPGTEYLAFKIRIQNTGTNGPGACDGCCEASAVAIQSLTLYGSGDPRPIIQQSYPVEWQSPTGCRPVPVATRSWGQLRGLYR